MSPTINISSSPEFQKILGSSTIVLTDFYADWCGPCKAISPVFESLSSKYSKPKRITFTKVNVDNQQTIASQYGVTAMPTFLIFKGGKVIDTIKGANQTALMAAVEKAVKLAGAAPVPLYTTPGRTLGGAPSTSLSRGFSPKKFIDAVIAFLGLYFTTLLSLDAYAAAENSPFNIHRIPPEPATGLRARAAASKPAGKKLGTISDISSGD